MVEGFMNPVIFIFCSYNSDNWNDERSYGRHLGKVGKIEPCAFDKNAALCKLTDPKFRPRPIVVIKYVFEDIYAALFVVLLRISIFVLNIILTVYLPF